MSNNPRRPMAGLALGPLAFFPREASAGDCLHRILERWITSSRPPNSGNKPAGGA